MAVKLCIFLITLWPLTSAEAFDHSYRDYGRLLDEVVVLKGQQTRVDYANLKSLSDRLDKLASEFSRVPLSTYTIWDSEQQLAFLINAYNLFTLQLVTRHYPDIESINDIGGFFGSPWKIRFFSLFGEKQHLDYLEHELIRNTFPEPRIHFALVCASISCPPLVKTPYQGAQLDKQLATVTHQFLTDPERNRYRSGDNVLELSSLFKWYKKDFIAHSGSLVAFVAPYLFLGNAAAVEDLMYADPGIQFLPYDWLLNSVIIND
ncbi:MAG: DUF547 domain-containing protein [Gammaproteobacteria bacterium]|nr:DUF547 domain-containing protein [Gammaproteobacteria bacterium]NIN61985.1 DUF547 domain-containing protein [Gammaproteobacteria bacterium]NIO62064.1 DUF547 domain-containing protein [Gammaproteobacteria bacterium]NIQ08326.1 DUF547 domain-containing protein [Gammaproteobacteria bacterium]NIQ19776.1 DUF547 domain-containing protein [Gammaproteobacteria bacterium]